MTFAFFLSISLGGLFFVLLEHCTRAGWSVVARRVAEAIAANVWLMAVLAIPVVLGMHHLYHWSDAAAVAHDPLIEAKVGFLNPTFFMIRLAIYFTIWGVMATFLYRTSLAQDASGDPALTLRMERLSAPGMVLFALSLNFAAFDLLMSLDPHWFSTIFGVYYFAASVVAFFAVMPKVLWALQSRGILKNAITVEHYHDFGKLLFAFVVFWAYIAFSQYMLIWYANVPEETEWFLKRQTGEWTTVSLLLIFGHFVVPFLLLVSRFIKRRPLLARRHRRLCRGDVLGRHVLAGDPRVQPRHRPFRPARHPVLSGHERGVVGGRGVAPQPAPGDRRKRPAPRRVAGLRKRVRMNYEFLIFNFELPALASRGPVGRLGWNSKFIIQNLKLEPPVRYDDPNVAASAVVGIISAILLFVIIVVLQAYFFDAEQAEMEKKV